MLVGSKILVTSELANGPKAKDITGQKIGVLTAERAIGKCKHNQAVWLFRCECGNTRQLRSNVLNGNSAKSCGCKTYEWSKRTNIKNKSHGMSGHPAYAVWNSMHGRCSLPNHISYKDYGGRGISVCERWNLFENFWADMGSTYQHGLTIERIDNNSGYRLDNCKWATRSEQNSNQRSRTSIQTPKGVMSIRDTSIEFGITYNTLVSRLRRGWTMEKIFTSHSRTTGG